MKSISICCLTVISFILISGCAERQNPAYGSGNAISFLSRIPVRGQAKAVAVVHDTAYVSDKGFGLSVYDLTDPVNPRLVDSLGSANGLDPENMGDLGVDSSGQILAVEQANSIRLINLRTKQYITNSDFSTGSDTKIRIIYDGQTLRTCHTDFNPTDGFFAIDFPNQGTPEVPQFSGGTVSYFANYVGPTGAWGFAWDPNGNRAVSCFDIYGFAYLDLTQVQNNHPKLLSFVNTPGATRDAAFSGNLVCLASGYEGLLIYDLSNDTLPVPVGQLQFHNSPDIVRVIAQGNRAYLLDTYDGIYAVDISNPAAPQLIGTLEAGHADDFVMSGNLMAMADEEEGLVIAQIMY